MKQVTANGQKFSVIQDADRDTVAAPGAVLCHNNVFAAFLGKFCPVDDSDRCLWSDHRQGVSLRDSLPDGFAVRL